MNRRLAEQTLIYPLHYLRQERIGAWLSEVRAVNGASRADIARYQRTRLCEVVRTARHSPSPGYAPLRGATDQLTEERIIGLLHDFPPQSKEAMRATVAAGGRPRGMASDYRSTSGSTGLPFQFYKDRYATGFMDAVLYAAYAWHGIAVGDPQARFWGMPLTPRGAALARIKDLLKNRLRFSAFDLSEGARESYYRSLHRFRPAYFYGYPSLMATFCGNLLEQGRTLRSLPLKAVIGTGEYLYPQERKLVEEATGVPFVNEYGCTEVGIIGFECPRQNLHVMSANIYLEVLKDGRPVLDDEGEIHVTELHTRSTPFIRYSLGDRGILCSAPCPCGSSLPVMQVLSGRKDDYVLTPDGRKVYDAIFAYTLKRGVSRFRAVQTAVDRIEIAIVPGADYSPELGSRYVRELQRHLGATVTIAISLVDTIEREPSGKLRYFRNAMAARTDHTPEEHGQP